MKILRILKNYMASTGRCKSCGKVIDYGWEYCTRCRNDQGVP